MWYNKSFFKYATGLILVLLIIFLFGQVGFILTPIKNALMVIALPLIVTLLFYYLLRPLVKILMKYKMPKIPSILISLLVALVFIVLVVSLAGNTINSEFNLLFKELPGVLESAENTATDMINSGNLDFVFNEDNIKKASDFIEKTVPVVGSEIFSGISTVISTVTLLLLVPFLLFYFLKDDRIFAKNFINVFPEKYKDEAKDILKDVDSTLSLYITGQAMICLVIGILMYIGYLIIGLKYALVLAMFSMITAIIPFFGPMLGILPAFLVGLSYELITLLKIFILMNVVQQLEGNFITPQIMGKRIHTHPIMIAIVILLSASLFGFTGILLAVPAYAILKVFIKNGVEIYRVIKNKK